MPGNALSFYETHPGDRPRHQIHSRRRRIPQNPILFTDQSTMYPGYTPVAWTWNFGYINKRWLIGLYNVAIVTFMVCPVAVERWRLRRLDSRAIPDRSPHKSRLRLISGVAVIVALAWYFTGPPWHLQRHHRPIDWHEQIHLGGLQAISKGYVPYIGPASSMYGPGSQILIYAAMRLADSFDIVSFRTAWAAVEFVTMVAWGLAAYWWLGLLAELLGLLPQAPLLQRLAHEAEKFLGHVGLADEMKGALLDRIDAPH